MKGAASAPPLIRQAFHSESSNPWSESGINLDQQSSIFDAQDVDLFSTQNPLADIEKAIKKLLDQNGMTAMVGAKILKELAGKMLTLI